MGTGTVKWFNPTKGFGFITQDDGGADLAVHRREVREPFDGTLTKGDTAALEETMTPSGAAAGNGMSEGKPRTPQEGRKGRDRRRPAAQEPGGLPQAGGQGKGG